ncbi:hypothetical protein B0T10DRAFT_37660 [Thelonectria olida]|uniref:Uncharacterized protein n=1 Tax=Thelonectria olida TaxID=1576542 RepID=A0A9P8WLT6_9HYPO|nr:hypothetical protein B0T10DRAFT_37660 [Thelonectria olida]
MPGLFFPFNLLEAVVLVQSPFAQVRDMAYYSRRSRPYSGDREYRSGPKTYLSYGPRRKPRTTKKGGVKKKSVKKTDSIAKVSQRDLRNLVMTQKYGESRSIQVTAYLGILVNSNLTHELTHNSNS